VGKGGAAVSVCALLLRAGACRARITGEDLSGNAPEIWHSPANPNRVARKGARKRGRPGVRAKFPAQRRPCEADERPPLSSAEPFRPSRCNRRASTPHMVTL